VNDGGSFLTCEKCTGISILKVFLGTGTEVFFSEREQKSFSRNENAGTGTIIFFREKEQEIRKAIPAELICK
jgi:hypothetical protein